MKYKIVLGLSMLTAFGIGLPAYPQIYGITPQERIPTFTGRIPISAATFSAQKPAPKVKFAGHRVIIKFNSGLLPPAGAFEAPGNAASALNQEALTALDHVQGRITKSFQNVGIHVIETPLAVGKAIETLYRSGAVKYAEPDYQVHTLVTTPNDPYFNYLWGLQNIAAPEAWDIKKDASNVIVGVIDTGVDYLHPDLSPNMWRNPKEIPGNGIDDDGNGWVDDVYGIDTYNHDADPMDDHRHGSHVSGTIGAKGNNGEGVTGVAWNVKIMALKFLAANGWGYDSGAIEAIDYVLRIKAANNYPRIILSNSWGGGDYSQALYDAIQTARDKGVLFVAAAGNDAANADNVPMYPAAYNLVNIISVGASDGGNNRTGFSNYGCNSVDVFAPGLSIFSTTLGGNYDYLSGTSMSTPHVSGMLALIWAANPGSNWRGVKSALLNSVAQLPSMNQLSVSQGRADLYQSLQPGSAKKPTVWSVSPHPAGPGVTISLTGANFGTSPGSVHFNGVPLTVLNWADSSIKAKIEAETPFSTGTLKVVRADGVVSEVGACYEVAYKPTLIGQTLLPRGWASGVRDSRNVFWIFGGETASGITGAVESIALPAGTPTLQAEWTMPTPLSNTAAAIIGSRIYVVGGYNPALGGVSSKLQIFDIVSGKWLPGLPKAGSCPWRGATTTPPEPCPLPEARMQLAVAAIGGKLYAFGGLNQSAAATPTTYIYNPVADHWSIGASKTMATAYATATTATNGKTVLVAGGFSCSTIGCEQNGVEEYDTVLNTWRAASPLNQARGGAAGGYYRNRHHVLFGSNKNTGGEYYNGGSSWTHAIVGGPALYTGLGAVGTGGFYMFIMDGYDQATEQYSANIWRISEP